MADETNYNLTPHKVFISYCWTSKEHEQWVHDLAERLVSNGVDVKYDKWDLKKGQDKFSFMEMLTVLLSAIAAFASVLSVLLVLKNNRDNKKHLRHRLEALDEECNGFVGNCFNANERAKVRVEMNTIKKDLKIKH